MVQIVHLGPSSYLIPLLDLSTTANGSQSAFDRDLAQLREEEIAHMGSTSRNIALRNLRNRRLRSASGSPAFVEAGMRAAAKRVLRARLERKRVLGIGGMEDKCERDGR